MEEWCYGSRFTWIFTVPLGFEEKSRRACVFEVCQLISVPFCDSPSMGRRGFRGNRDEFSGSPSSYI